MLWYGTMLGLKSTRSVKILYDYYVRLYVRTGTLWYMVGNGNSESSENCVSIGILR